MTLRRVLITWVILAVLMTANGAFRELFLKSQLEARTADFISAMLGIMIILAVTFISFRAPADYPIASLLLLSMFLVALTVAFEFGFGHYVGHKSWSELAANYRFWEGKLWPLVLLTLAITPFLARGRG